MGVGPALVLAALALLGFAAGWAAERRNAGQDAWPLSGNALWVGVLLGGVLMVALLAAVIRLRGAPS